MKSYLVFLEQVYGNHNGWSAMRLEVQGRDADVYLANEEQNIFLAIIIIDKYIDGIDSFKVDMKKLDLNCNYVALMSPDNEFYFITPGHLKRLLLENGSNTISLQKVQYEGHTLREVTG